MTTPYKDSVEMCERISELEQDRTILVETLEEIVNSWERYTKDFTTVSDPYGICYTATQLSGVRAKAILKAKQALATMKGGQ
jgi:hypothetical protein